MYILVNLLTPRWTSYNCSKIFPAIIPTGQLVLCAGHTATAYVTINQFNHLRFSGNYTVPGLMPEALHVTYTLYLHILYDS